MAAFATMAAADARAVAKVADGTWINAHSQRGITGTIGVRVQRKMSAAGLATASTGGWVEITDDGTV
jgi:hypothetical protein